MVRLPRLVPLFLLLPRLAAGNPAPPPYKPESPPLNGPTAPLGNLSCAAAPTVTFGGTVWDGGRWEAIAGGTWTFQSGVGSWINDGRLPGKPIGYHGGMEGWTGLDRSADKQPWFRRSSTCAINGSWSLWAGLNAAEAANCLYADGQGYGNNWDICQGKSFFFPGGASTIDLQFSYSVESEPGFDFCQVWIQPAGGVPAQVGTNLDGTQSGVFSVTLTPGLELPPGGGAFDLWFKVHSDGGYSDEDGLYPTTCGLVAIDDVKLTLMPSNTVLSFDTFEAGSDGWSSTCPGGAGDFTTLATLNDLPPPLTFCSCGMVDTVLTLYDETLAHPVAQDNVAVSPVIDAYAAGCSNLGGRYVQFDMYAELPIENYVFIQVLGRSWKPGDPQSDITGVPFRTFDSVFYFNTPVCSESPFFLDVSGLLEAGAREHQIALGMVNLCASSPFGPACTGVTNSTPYFDNVTVGIYGRTDTPALTIRAMDFLQDSFATDGTLNPGSPARLDMNRFAESSDLYGTRVLGDTMVVRGGGPGTEVYVHFRVRPGPFTNLAALDGWRLDNLGGSGTRWVATSPMPGYFNNTWYRARMNVAQRGGVPVPGFWMSTVHPQQIYPSGGMPAGWETNADPSDPGHLAADIFPDDILTPGSRIDYYFEGKNTGGACSVYLPNAPSELYEVEVLPSSMAGDMTWNCRLYVDHHQDRDAADQVLEESTLSNTLGTGGSNAEGTLFDRWDVQSPTSNQLSFARSGAVLSGASSTQIAGYSQVVWHAGNSGRFPMTADDAGLLAAWLPSGPGDKSFWGTGEDLPYYLNFSGPSAQSFLRNTLGATLTCGSISIQNCPAGSTLDVTTCRQTSAVAGSHFAVSSLPRISHSDCFIARGPDLMGTYVGAPTARGQLSYIKSGTPRNYASITNMVTGATTYRSVIDGFGLGLVRDQPSCASQTTAPAARAMDVLTWFGMPLGCRLPAPGGVSLTIQCNAIKVSWGAVTGAVNYRVFRDNLDISGLLPTSPLEYVDGSPGGVAHCYAVAAVDINGQDGTKSSPTVCGTAITAAPTVTDPVDMTVAPGGSVTFSVTATGSSLTYVWRKDTVNLSNSNSNTYTINPAQLSDEGAYDVVVSNACGSVTSAAATLTVCDGPFITPQPPPTVTAMDGDLQAMIVSGATGTPAPTLQWYFGSTQLTNGAHYSGVDGGTLTILNVVAADAGYYHLEATNTCGTAISNITQLVLVGCPNPPVITQQPMNVTVPLGSPASFTVAATACMALAYQWQRFTFKASCSCFVWQNIPGAALSTHSIPSVTSSDAGLYRCVVTAGGKTAISNSAKLNFITPQITSLTSTPLSCNQTKICWTTNVPTTGVIMYGNIPSSLNTSTAPTPLATSGCVTITKAPPPNCFVYKLVATPSTGPALTSQIKAACLPSTPTLQFTVTVAPNLKLGCAGLNPGVMVSVKVTNTGCATAGGPIRVTDLRIKNVPPTKSPGCITDLPRTIATNLAAGASASSVPAFWFRRSNIPVASGSQVTLNGKATWNGNTYPFTATITLP